MINFSFFLTLCLVGCGQVNQQQGASIVVSNSLTNEASPKVEVDTSQFDLYGEWEIVKYVFSTISGMDDTEAKSYIGKTIRFTNELAKTLHEDCETPHYHIRSSDAKEYFYFNYRFYPTELGIDSKLIDLVELYCSESIPNFDQDEFLVDYVVFKNEYLIGNWDGVFFFFTKKEIE